MYKVLKFGVYFGVVASLVGCSASEHFMQDDVYNTRTPIMPPGTDLNDVTDYATFVAKKEQTETPERTTYVSPRQYNDHFYHSQYAYYGYSPYSAVTGLGYYGYGNSFGSNTYYGYNYNPYGYNHPYYGGNPSSSFYGQYYPYYSGNTSWYSPKGKPNTGFNSSHASAGSSAGRLGSSTNGGIVSYPNKLTANSNHSSGVGRTPAFNTAPVVNNNSGRNANLNGREIARPASSGRSSTPVQRTDSYQRTGNSNTNSGTNNRTINNTDNNSNTRTSSPTIRSGGSSGGSVSTPSSGGSRSGGRR